MIRINAGFTRTLSCLQFPMRVAVTVAVMGLIFTSSASAIDMKKAAKQIDFAVKKGLMKKKLKPNPKINDLTFLRRIYLDTIGRIPTHEEFLSWQNQRRRDRDALIAQLVKRPAYGSHQFNYWTNVLRAQSRLRWGSGENYLNYIRQALTQNMPYDKFVFNMIASSGNSHAAGNGAVGYYFRDSNMPLDNLSLTTQVFLGTDMSCAQCHDDPFSDWTQMDFYQLSAFTTGMNWRGGYSIRNATKHRPDIKEDRQKTGFVRNINDILSYSVKGGGTGLARLPGDYKYEDAKPNEIVTARTLFGDNPKLNVNKNASSSSKGRRGRGPVGTDINARKHFAQWMTSPSNPMFTKTITNRMWHKMMGATLIGPLTDLEEDDMGINPELTKVLVQIMKDVKYDLKKFEQIVFMSSTYQSEMTISDVEGTDKYAFQGPILTRLTATQLWDSLMVLKNENLDKGFSLAPVVDRNMRIYERLKNAKAEDIIALIPTGPMKSYNELMEKIANGGGMAAADKPEKEKMYVLAAPKKSSKRTKGKMSAKKKSVVDQKSKSSDGGSMMSSGGMMSMQGMMSMSGNAAAKRKDKYSRASYYAVPQSVSHFIRQFGQSDRLLVDSDSTEASIPQALAIMNGLVEQIAQDKNASINKRIYANKDDAARIRTAYEMIMARNAASFEVSKFKALLKRNKNNFSDVVWVLLNSNEFKFRK